MSLWTPRHLLPEQITELYAQALAQAEAQVVNAWINLQLAPEDEARAAAYRQAANRLAALEADLTRVLQQLPERVGVRNTVPAQPEGAGETSEG